MDTWIWFIVGVPVALVVGGVLTNMMRTNSFAKMGDITGKTIDEIKAHVGEPTSISAAVDGTLYQWINANSGGAYHYAILFNTEGRAVGYTHQYAG